MKINVSRGRGRNEYLLDRKTDEERSYRRNVCKIKKGQEMAQIDVAGSANGNWRKRSKAEEGWKEVKEEEEEEETCNECLMKLNVATMSNGRKWRIDPFWLAASSCVLLIQSGVYSMLVRSKKIPKYPSIP